MWIKLSTLCFVALLSAGTGIAQEKNAGKESKGSFSNFIRNEKLALKLNYFGELGLHPGIEIGSDFQLIQKKWVTLHWDVGIGGFYHRWNNTSVFIRSTVGARFLFWNFFIDVHVGAGYYHSFLAGHVYGPAEGGGVERARDWGTSHFMPSTALLLGWNNTKNGKLPWTFHIGPEFYLQSNFNHIFLPHVAANVGITYNFKQ